MAVPCGSRRIAGRLALFPRRRLYRFLQTLTNQRLLAFRSRAPDLFAPGVRLVRLAHAAWDQSSLAPNRPPAPRRAVCPKFGADGASGAARSRSGAVRRQTQCAADPIEMFSQAAGKVGPAYCTGVGKAMLAFPARAALSNAAFWHRQSWHRFTDTDAGQIRLRSARRAGREHQHPRLTPIDREEHEPGIICTAVPFRSS